MQYSYYELRRINYEHIWPLLKEKNIKIEMKKLHTVNKTYGNYQIRNDFAYIRLCGYNQWDKHFNFISMLHFNSKIRYWAAQRQSNIWIVCGFFYIIIFIDDKNKPLFSVTIIMTYNAVYKIKIDQKKKFCLFWHSFLIVNSIPKFKKGFFYYLVIGIIKFD